MPYDIVYIGASWCAPCKQVRPMVIEKAAKYGLKLTIYDIDDDVDKLDVDSVKKLPTIQVKQDSKQVAEFITNHVAALEEFLSTHVSLKTTDVDF